MSAGEIVKVLTECSSDNLFVLTGLAFMALAVVGNIWMIRPAIAGAADADGSLLSCRSSITVRGSL